MATTRICSIPSCGKPHYAFSFCKKHYERFKSCGDPLAPKYDKEAPIEWLERHKDFAGDECLAWPFANKGNGYGYIKVDGQRVTAHRKMCFLAHGPHPADKPYAAHSCGKGDAGCVNPRHLRWASRRENEDDKILHGSLKGEKHPGVKLSEEDVRLIRSLKGTAPSRVIAIPFGVTKHAVKDILSGRSWSWLPD